MGSFRNIAIFTPNRRFPMTTSLHDALLPYFIKWVSPISYDNKSPRRVIALFYQMGSFGNFLFWVLDFIYLTLIRTGLNQPNSTGTRFTAIK
jgi:hypothetical protein